MGVKVREKPKGSGEWWIFIDHQGKRQARKIGRNEDTAQKVAKQVEARLLLGQYDFDEKRKPKVPTFKEYVEGWRDDSGKYEGWFDKVAKLSLKNSTRRGYRLILDTHLIPQFGKRPLDEITSRMVGNYILSLFQKKLRSGTIRNIKNCLSAVLRHAQNPDNYIAGNPARGVMVPHPENEEPAREPDPFTWEDRNQVEETFREHHSKYYPLVLCGFRTGLRIGELIALQWQDIDFHNRLILVQRNVTRGKITTPKSRSSRRSVRMTAQLVSVLKDHLKAVKEAKLKKGWENLPDWVFFNEAGSFLSYPAFVDRVWNKAMTKSELRRRTPHDMRHTYATLRLSKGDSLAEVSKEMGHSTTEITYRTYYKWLPQESRSNIDELDRTQSSATYPQPDTSEMQKGASRIG